MLMNQEYLNVFSKALYYFICDRYVPPSERAEVPVTVQKGNKNTEEKKIIWVNQPPDHNHQRRGRRPATNILNSDAGAVLGRARDCEREIDCVELFISKDIQELLVAEMNRKIANYIEDNQGKPRVTIPDYTDLMEFKAFIGLWYARGFFEWNYTDVDRLWNTSTSNPIFAGTMSKKRFKQLLMFLTFDDRSTRQERFRTDRGAAIRDMFETFNENCSR